MKLHPNDIITTVALGWILLVAVVSFLFGGWGYALVGLAFITIFLLNHYQNRIYRVGAKITWLDYMKIRDMMAHGNNFEAIRYTLKKAYNMSDEEILTLSPDDFHTLMEKLKLEPKGGVV